MSNSWNLVGLVFLRDVTLNDLLRLFLPLAFVFTWSWEVWLLITFLLLTILLRDGIGDRLRLQELTPKVAQLLTEGRYGMLDYKDGIILMKKKHTFCSCSLIRLARLSSLNRSFS